MPAIFLLLTDFSDSRWGLSRFSCAVLLAPTMAIAVAVLQLVAVVAVVAVAVVAVAVVVVVAVIVVSATENVILHSCV